MKNIDHEKVDRFNKNTFRILSKIQNILDQEMKSGSPETVEFCVHACVYAPINFVMEFFSVINKMGFDTSKDFPAFITVYKNYLKTISDMEEDWKNLPYDQFEKKFVKKYRSLGHIVNEVED